MPSPFWTNTVWYLALLATSAAALIVALYRSKNRTFTAAFTFAVLGLVYLCEYIIVIYFDAYSYFPKITADPMMDTVFGNMFSQVSISTTVVLLITLDLPLVWYFVCAATYFFIELLFVHLGIYEQHWYQAYFTPVILVPLLLGVKKWHYKVIGTSDGFLYWLTAFFAANAAAAQLNFALKLLNLHVFRWHLFEDPTRDHVATLLFFTYPMLIVFICLRRWKMRWPWHVAALVFFILVDYALHLLGISQSREGWYAVGVGCYALGVYGAVTLMSRWLNLNARSPAR